MLQSTANRQNQLQISKEQAFVLWFEEVGIADIPLVGGKNASLGEMIQQLTPKGVNVPTGFATTAHAYRYFIDRAGLQQQLRALFADLDVEDVNNLRQRGKQARALILNTPFPSELASAIVVPFCRTPAEGRKVVAEMEKYGLKRGENGLQVYVMCEIPNNVVLAKQFSEVFDGFSIGSNDLTQLTLGLDRDSGLVAHLFDERNEGVKEMVQMAIAKAKENQRKIGICGQAPSDYPEFARFLVEQGIDSIGLNPDSVLKTLLEVAAVEGVSTH
ncbi:hypothetical protein B7486_45315 [cyanobacterium TDX16]|nr:hypothetical protein B7486_45315 [cyanobacterium TDX16]